ncbi:hypothetical protein [Ancylobacter novellus]|nr:hypothetical protein [Ancylobacter novellus]
MLALAAVFGIILGMPAVTSTPTGFVSSTPEPPASHSPSTSPRQTLQVPSPPVLMALLRSTLAAVNQANVTGNYSVLRDLGSPAFRENYNPAQLADRFRPWRDNSLDFAAILLLDAKLSRAPSIDEHGVLQLAGYFPTEPLRIGFDLGFQAVNGNWRLSTISVNARDSSSEVGNSEAKTSLPDAPPAKSTASKNVQPVGATASITEPSVPRPFNMRP